MLNSQQPLLNWKQILGKHLDSWLKCKLLKPWLESSCAKVQLENLNWSSRSNLEVNVESSLLTKVVGLVHHHKSTLWQSQQAQIDEGWTCKKYQGKCGCVFLVGVWIMTVKTQNRFDKWQRFQILATMSDQGWVAPQPTAPPDYFTDSEGESAGGEAIPTRGVYLPPYLPSNRVRPAG